MKRIFLLAAIAWSSVLYAQQIPIPDAGWRLWLDRSAAWETDSIYLPQDVRLEKLEQRPPTGGWDVLSASNGIPVTLPATVEQFYWGVNGYRPYRQEYAYEAEDTVVKNGNYLGISWWWRELDIPASFRGKQVVLTIRGARLRAEVFCNRQLVGYNIITETAFTCDLTKAVKPGQKNQLAIRITNPGGRLDWVDTELLSWGKTDQTFHKSHGFGGLDRGMTLSARDPVHINDAWVLNTAAMKDIQVHAVVENTGATSVTAVVCWEIFAGNSKRAAVTKEERVEIPAAGRTEVRTLISHPAAKLWTLSEPNLYTAGVSVKTRKPVSADSRMITFGFRWFAPEGIGSNAVLRFNGERVRITSAISWGFWGVNGLWPTPELAEREVRAAKRLGMNCIQFHRNIGKTEVLDAQDRLGLLRYMEPGGGQTSLGSKYSYYAPSPAGPIDISGDSPDVPSFAERYMEEKIARMVRDHRSHPSLVMYAIQNEIHPDLHNPRVFRILRLIHKEDPSRTVVLKSGFPGGSPSTNQAWMEPYSDVVRYDTGSAYSGWWDDHTVGGPGVWRDDMYKSPVEFTHRSTNDREIVMWGEMLGAAVPDNHAVMVGELKATYKSSYDLKEHETILAAYDAFLDRWGFRKAFPTADALFTAIGNKSYDFWGRVLETARLAESNDYFVISGWESTAIENHSGLVDNLRNFKGNPDLIRDRLAPLRPVIRTSSLVFPTGDAPAVDLTLENETLQAHPASMHLSVIGPDGRIVMEKEYPIPAFEKDRFVYPVASGVVVPAFAHEGVYTVRAEAGTARADERLTVLDVPASITGISSVGILSSLPGLQKPFELLPGVKAEPYRKDHKYDLVVAANRFTRPAVTQTDSTTVIEGTRDPELYRHIYYGDASSIEFLFPGLPNDTATVTLKFAELFQNGEGLRVFDVALNGDTVLKDFDVFKAAGGKNKAVDRTFRVPVTNGIVHITFPRVPRPSARICAIKIELPDTVLAVWSGGRRYRDSDNRMWKPYGPPAQFGNELLTAVRNGMPLLVLAEGEAAAEFYAEELGNAGAFEYRGYVGEAFASWMGSWYFVREHPLYNGLPVNCEMGSVYQVPVTNSAGVLVEGRNVDIAAAYSRDHDRRIGAASFTSSLDRGKIVFHSLSGAVSALTGGREGIHPLVFRRILANSLRVLATGTK